MITIKKTYDNYLYHPLVGSRFNVVFRIRMEPDLDLLHYETNEKSLITYASQILYVVPRFIQLHGRILNNITRYFYIVSHSHI